MDIQSISNLPAPTVTTVDRPATPPPAREPAAPAQTADPVDPAGAVPTLPQLAQAVKNINKTLQEQSRNLEFSLDTDSKRTVIKVIDQKTKEILRQIPSEEVLEIAKALDHMQQGLLIRQTV